MRDKAFLSLNKNKYCTFAEVYANSLGHSVKWTKEIYCHEIKIRVYCFRDNSHKYCTITGQYDSTGQYVSSLISPNVKGRLEAVFFFKKTLKCIISETVATNIFKWWSTGMGHMLGDREHD